MNFIEIKDKDGKVTNLIRRDSIIHVQKADWTVWDEELKLEKIVYNTIIYFSNGTSTSVDVPIEDIISQMKDSQDESKSLSNSPSWLKDMMVQPPFS